MIVCKVKVITSLQWQIYTNVRLQLLSSLSLSFITKKVTDSLTVDAQAERWVSNNGRYKAWFGFKVNVFMKKSIALHYVKCRYVIKKDVDEVVVKCTKTWRD